MLQWVKGTPVEAYLEAHSEQFDDFVRLVGGHPLAAKNIASYLLQRSPDQLLESRQRRRFQLRLAQFILTTIDQKVLGDLHKLLLQALSVVREPVSLSDIMSVRVISNPFSLDAIQEARLQLSDWFLLEHKGELMYLHEFMATYFRSQLDTNPSLRNEIAADFGMHAYNKANELNQEMQTLLESSEGSPESSYGEQGIAAISNEVLRYAVIAGRLLRMVDKHDLVQRLPFQFEGTLREMVFYYYQRAKDYDRALEYAQQWLQVNPNDREIMLYMARCYIRRGHTESLEKASKIIKQIERQDHNKRFAARLSREKAVIAEQSGDLEGAKRYYRQGISFDSSTNIFPENYAGLARLLLREADEYPEWDSKRAELAREAVGLLERIDRESAGFERYYLSTYIDALIQAGIVTPKVKTTRRQN